MLFVPFGIVCSVQFSLAVTCSSSILCWSNPLGQCCTTTLPYHPHLHRETRRAASNRHLHELVRASPLGLFAHVFDRVSLACPAQDRPPHLVEQTIDLPTASAQNYTASTYNTDQPSLRLRAQILHPTAVDHHCCPLPQTQPSRLSRH